MHAQRYHFVEPVYTFEHAPHWGTPEVSSSPMQRSLSSQRRGPQVTGPLDEFLFFIRDFMEISREYIGICNYSHIHTHTYIYTHHVCMYMYDIIKNLMLSSFRWAALYLDHMDPSSCFSSWGGLRFRHLHCGLQKHGLRVLAVWAGRADGLEHSRKKLHLRICSYMLHKLYTF